MIVSPVSFLQLLLPGSQTAGCCDSVRSPLHDSLASHSLCPCQLDRVLQHRVSTMPVNLLPRPSFNEAGFTIGATDLSAFYSPLVSCLKLVWILISTSLALITFALHHSLCIAVCSSVTLQLKIFPSINLIEGNNLSALLLVALLVWFSLVSGQTMWYQGMERFVVFTGICGSTSLRCTRIWSSFPYRLSTTGRKVNKLTVCAVTSLDHLRKPLVFYAPCCNPIECVWLHLNGFTKFAFAKTIKVGKTNLIS